MLSRCRLISLLPLFFCLLFLSTNNFTQVESAATLDGPPVIERFEAVPDCIYPDRRRGILSYRVTNVVRVRIDAIHRGGRVRAFHTAGGRTLWPSLSAAGVVDPLAADDIEAYVLTATGDGKGAEVRKRIDFRYRRSEFNLIPPSFHVRDTTGGDHFTRYEIRAHVTHIDSLTCSFRFDRPIAGEAGREGFARVGELLSDGHPTVTCEFRWRDVRKARAGGTAEWIARVTDPCTQGRITRTARVNAIP
jgi:hypothetical protein